MATVAVSVPGRTREESPDDEATWPCAEEARRLFAMHGLEVTEFPASGRGGRELEAAVAAGRIAGVLELTLTELVDEQAGGALSAGPDRLTAAALRGVPQVIVPGAVDRLNGLPETSHSAAFAYRRVVRTRTGAALLRTTPAENDRLGREIALKASAARGPTSIVLPSRGLSALDREGQPFLWPEADRALFQSIRNWVSPDVLVDELDMQVNDPQFARAVVERLLSFLSPVR